MVHWCHVDFQLYWHMMQLLLVCHDLNLWGWQWQTCIGLHSGWPTQVASVAWCPVLLHSGCCCFQCRAFMQRKSQSMAARFQHPLQDRLRKSTSAYPQDMKMLIYINSSFNPKLAVRSTFSIIWKACGQPVVVNEIRALAKDLFCWNLGLQHHAKPFKSGKIYINIPTNIHYKQGTQIDVLVLSSYLDMFFRFGGSKDVSQRGISKHHQLQRSCEQLRVHRAVATCRWRFGEAGPCTCGPEDVHSSHHFP